MKTLLTILAHPDDESFGPGATLAKYAREGVAVHALCATRGESGTVDPEMLNGYHDVAELRMAELACAARELGLAGLEYLGYRDSGMVGTADNSHVESLYTAPVDQVAQRIAGFIQRIQPDVIITHDQFGGYGHPDHIKCHQGTLRAYELLYGMTITSFMSESQAISQAVNSANQKFPKLYFTVFPRGLLKYLVRLMPLLRQDPRKFGRNRDIDLVQIASWEVPITTRINVQPYIDVKERASACHASQRPPTQQTNLFMRVIFRRSQKVDFFSRAYPPVRKGEPLEKDLFAGW